MTNREALEIITQHLRKTFCAIDNNSELSFTQNPIGERMILGLMEDETPEKMDEEFHPKWPWPREPENEEN